jgi:hypothetical protein
MVVLLSMGVYLIAPTGVATSGPGNALLGHAGAGASRSAGPMTAVRSIAPSAVRAANATFNPECFPLNATLCVSIAAPTTPDIIPIPPNHNAPYMPNATDNITLYLKSEYNLQFPGDQANGPKSPIAINVSGILWNGDPYFCTCDDSIWHANFGGTNQGTWWTAPQGLQGTNKTYPDIYEIQILPHNYYGQQQFFAGETVSWYIYVVSYNTKHQTETGTQVGPTFTYRIAGAWPFSPWPEAVQYGGPNASTSDLTARASPLVPNWNDTIALTIQLTAAAVTNRTLIGLPASAFVPYVRLSEMAPNGTPLVQNATYLFPYQTGTGGASELNLTLPATLTQVAGATLTYQITVQDAAKYETNTIALPMQTVIINGNGSFPTEVFPNDLFLNTSINTNPVFITQVTAPNITTIGPGVNLTITVQTRSLSTSIQSAEVLYTFTYLPLGESTFNVLPMVRVNSTAFWVNIPSMPLSSVINFTVEASDYSHHLDISPVYEYATQTLPEWVTVIPQNETFFYIYVFNNQTQSYLSGSQVQIREVRAAGINTLSTTRFGIAYPNATGNDYLPLLVPANETYNITVIPYASANLASEDHEIDVVFNATGQTAIAREHRTLQKGGDYYVLQEGNSLYFWVNGTVSTTIYAPSQGNSGVTAIAGIIGLAGAAVVSIVVWMWFRDVQARRKAEEKRVTL